MSSVPASAPVSVTSSSSSGAVESPKAHSIDWLTGARRDVEADARALAATDIREIDTDVPAYTSTLLKRLTKIEDLRARMLHHRMPTWGLDNIERYAVVASNANATKSSPRVADPANRELLNTSTRYIGTCKTEIGFMVSRGWVQASVLEGLPTYKSFLNNSVSLMRCALVLEEHRERLAASQSKITADDIAHYIEVAEQLSRIGAERQLPEDEPEDDMPARTFTLLDMAVDEVRAGIAYLFYKTPEMVELYVPKKPKKPAKTKSTRGKKADAKAKAEQQPEKAPTNKPSVGNAQAPDARKEDRAAE
jgi:hypothetical protein